jgi:hypothetical protein
MSKFSTNLETWWKKRIQDYKKSKPLSPLTIRGILYLLRQQVGVKGMPKTKAGFYSALERVEKQYKVPREKLRIVTEPKVNLISRNGECPLLKADLKEFQNACALIYIEKSTIIEAIEEDKSLTDRGILIVKAMGFSSREANRIIKEAHKLGLPILTLTDYDPSGILIDLKIKDSGIATARLGVDPDLVNKLNLKLDDVREPLPREKTKLAHYKYLKTKYPKLAKGFLDIGVGGNPYRIEIDGVFALAGKDRFIEEILKRADNVVQVKSIHKALRHKKVPENVDRMKEEMHSMVDKLFEQVSEKAEKSHVNDKDSFNNFRLSKIEKDIEKTINSNSSAATMQVLQDTINNLQKLLDEQNKKSITKEIVKL